MQHLKNIETSLNETNQKLQAILATKAPSSPQPSEQSEITVAKAGSAIPPTELLLVS
jgi:hypothetical protein